ncbi:hypothetical protein [Macrococcus capreoli]
MKWVIATIIILIIVTAETYFSIRVYKKHVNAGTYEANKKKILLMRFGLYLLLYLIGFAIFAISKN